MESLTRLVTDSLARHGFDRPIDPRRLQWSRWFRCDSPHSLLVVPSKPGIFAIAEEVGASVARDSLPLWLAAVRGGKPRIPSDLEARMLQVSALPIDFLLHDEVRNALRRGFWDALEQNRL